MNKVTFRCKRSGNCVSFSNPNDVAGLRKHEGYVEVSENGMQEKIQETTEEVIAVNAAKRRGRPRRDMVI